LFFLQIDLSDLPALESCCNSHDICYESCGKSRSECDRVLQQCAKQVCVDASNNRFIGSKILGVKNKDIFMTALFD